MQFLVSVLPVTRVCIWIWWDKYVWEFGVLIGGEVYNTRDTYRWGVLECWGGGRQTPEGAATARTRR